MLAQVSERLEAAQENAAQQAAHAAGRQARLEQCVVTLPGLECGSSLVSCKGAQTATSSVLVPGCQCHASWV